MITKKTVVPFFTGADIVDIAVRFVVNDVGGIIKYEIVVQ
jgi:hypothetical protein